MLVIQAMTWRPSPETLSFSLLWGLATWLHDMTTVWYLGLAVGLWSGNWWSFFIQRSARDTPFPKHWLGLCISGVSIMIAVHYRDAYQRQNDCPNTWYRSFVKALPYRGFFLLGPRLKESIFKQETLHAICIRLTSCHESIDCSTREPEVVDVSTISSHKSPHPS